MATKWSQKTYVMVAGEVKSVVETLEPEEQVARDALRNLADNLSTKFEMDNPAFQNKKFVKACGF